VPVWTGEPAAAMPSAHDQGRPPHAYTPPHLAEELGMQPLVAHCHLGLGKLHAKTGRRAVVRTELSAAIELYRAMAMTLWLPQAEAALAQVGGPGSPGRKSRWHVAPSINISERFLAIFSGRCLRGAMAKLRADARRPDATPGAS
jgi:hypothetical protein